MSRRSLQIAREHGSSLPAFPSQAEAERALFLQRDERLARIRGWAADSGMFVADGTPESLKALEAWYFEVGDNRDVAIGATSAEVKESIGAYFGQVLCGSSGFEWIVGEDAFVPGHYAIGVRKALCTVWVSNGISPDAPERNRRRQSLFRMYRKLAF
jgi:hypothetical protein